MLHRRLAIIDVALTAMAENRWRSATVAAICAEANLSKRYFYESFRDLDELGAAVIEGVASEIGRSAVAAFEMAINAPVAIQARAAVDSVVGSIGADRRKALVLLGGVAWSPILHAERTAAMRRLTDTFVTYARIEHSSESSVHPLTSTVVAFIIGGTAQAILAWIEGDHSTETDRLIDDVTALWLSVGASTADITSKRSASTKLSPLSAPKVRDHR